MKWDFQSFRKKISVNRENISVKDHRGAVIILSAFLILQLIRTVLTWNNPPFWDSALYIGMGKHLFSLGEIGLWESFRPPILPVMTGLLWFLGGRDQLLFRILPLTISTLSLTAIYLAVDDLFDRVQAIFTLGIISMSFIYFNYSTKLLTGIGASALVFMSLYLVQKDRLFLSGLIGALAFLMRFPAGLVLAAGGFFIFYKSNIPKLALKLNLSYNKVFRFFRSGSKYTGGFLALTLPYMALNKYYLGSGIQPFIDAATVPAAVNSDKYLYGVYYLFNLTLSNPLLIFSVIGLFIVLRNREKNYYSFISGLLLFYSFFTVYSHKEVRYGLLFLPLISLFAARGVLKSKQIFEDRLSLFLERTRLAELRFIEVFIFISVLGMILSGLASYKISSQVNQDKVQFYEHQSKLEGQVASNDAVIMAYGDIEYKPMVPNYLAKNYRESLDNVDYYSINGCAWYCTRSQKACDRELQSLKTNLSEHQKVFERKSESCNYTVYRGDRD